jgi:predicted SprT family Zn-dependent metalloprotease
MDRNLVEFFRRHGHSAFRRAISDLCRYYNVKRPRIEWYEYIDWGKTAGRTFEDGRIHLVHPENWKRGRIYNSERMWVQTVYHELAHYLFWTDAERKAEVFTQRMVRGLRRTERRRQPTMAARRTSAARTRRARVATRRGAESRRGSRRSGISTTRPQRRLTAASPRRGRRRRSSRAA